MTHIAANIGALDGQDVTYISTPCININKHYLMQGHHLKYDDARNLVFFFPRYTNEIPLPNPDLHLYNPPTLIFPLVPQEEAHRNSMFGRVTRSRARNKASSS